jgi:hypothetical protein
MANEFKKCPNGHYYQGDHCPYCKTSGANETKTESPKTQVYGGGIGQSSPSTEYRPTSTETIAGSMFNSPQKTTVVGEGGGVTANPIPSGPTSHTVFGDEYEPTLGDASKAEQGGGFRETRKLVGWLVSYTLDAMGVDFKLYEGRNIIGRNADCNISVNDNMVSGKHAVILFRSGKYSITDSQSSHGTFVNDRDIDLEPCYLQDGDMIRMGKTLFKFRSSF